jgi:hypothetical protein
MTATSGARVHLTSEHYGSKQAKDWTQAFIFGDLFYLLRANFTSGRAAFRTGRNDDETGLS